ncbi:MAG: DUF898 domain-containing protein [Magnetococcales bacterium]|nr:DUF898 domain-containing protein [Magnetococcales bacterium]
MQTESENQAVTSKPMDSVFTDPSFLQTQNTPDGDSTTREDIEQSEDYEKIWSQVQFTGTGAEYFRIWIVNLLLSILTLGIYSAWAKVRRTRYFYNHVNIDGHNLEYTARPWQILKGRIIAALVLGIIAGLSATANPTALVVAGVIQLGVFLLIPVILVLSMRFALHNTQYRAINFDFSGRYKQAYATFLFWPMLIIPTLGLILPFVAKKQVEFLMEKTLLGKTPFEFNPQLTSKSFYWIYAKFIGLILALGFMKFIFEFIGAFVLFFLHKFGIEQSQENLQIFIVTIYLIVLFSSTIWLQLSVFGLIWNQACLDNIIFKTTLNPYRGLWIHISNMILRVITLGLAAPWCQIRWTRYKIESLSVQTNKEMSASFIAANKSGKDGNIAEGLDDLGGMDLGI